MRECGVRLMAVHNTPADKTEILDKMGIEIMSRLSGMTTL